MNKQVIIIIGASKGLGREIAISLSKLNCIVILNGRNKENCKILLIIINYY